VGHASEELAKFRKPLAGARGSLCCAPLILQSRDREGVIMALRAWASLARLDKLKLIPRGHASACLPGDSPALARGPPKAMKLDLRCSSTEQCFPPIQLQVPLQLVLFG
jgi:hypothetical protein